MERVRFDDINENSDASLPTPTIANNDDELNLSFEVPAPRPSTPLDDDEHIRRSMEIPRRAYCETPLIQPSREYLDVRLSDRFTDLIGSTVDDLTYNANDQGLQHSDHLEDVGRYSEGTFA